LEIGKILCRLREAQGLSQGEMAQKLGFSASYLSLLERNKRAATMHVLRALSSWTGVPAGLFLLQSMELSDLGPRQRKLVREIQREFRKALASGDFTVLQRIAQAD
jgi:transcriptional regulator with XRE-family HTH domain